MIQFMIEKEEISYFSNKIFDLSNFEGSAYFGHEAITYTASLAQRLNFKLSGKGEDPIYKELGNPFYSVFLI